MCNTLENKDLILWAFEKGYKLANENEKESIHIEFAEIEKHFLNELREFQTKRNELTQTAS